MFSSSFPFVEGICQRGIHQRSANFDGSLVALLRWRFEVMAAQFRTRCRFIADGNWKARSTGLWSAQLGLWIRLPKRGITALGICHKALLLKFLLFSQSALLKHPYPCITELYYFSWAKLSRILSPWYVHVQSRERRA